MKKHHYYLLTILIWLPGLVAAQISANFTHDPSADCSGTNIAFTDTSTGVGISNWLWDFGDGNTSTDQHPTHIYTDVGAYNVCLTADDGLGNSDMTCQLLTLAELTSSSEVSVYVGCVGDGI